ncbi:hypothetical protein O6H91_15G058200 [Diphasiastrum complanatum]|uniref:Uncharacterized protein n=1 Tax=Diphasiastrum complanatum TaxID=34168 RepID=A0ACC2BIQ0_DIPCM|nr:hypothetical protein O6H91_15G058200 [Diphasiastrum complanatum]
MERSVLLDQASGLAMAQANYCATRCADLYGCGSQYNIQRRYASKLADGRGFFGDCTPYFRSQGARNAAAPSTSGLNQATSIAARFPVHPRSGEFPLEQKKHAFRLVAKALSAHVLLEKSEASYEQATSLTATRSPVVFAKAIILPLADSGTFQTRPENASWEKDRLRLEQARLGVGFLFDEEKIIRPISPEKKVEGVVISSKRRLERILKRERVQQKTKAQLRVETMESPTLQGDHDKQKNTSTRTRLLTAAEENKLAMATKELMRMEAMKAQLLQVLNREPTSSEWSKALKMDSLEFSQKLRYGHSCRHKLFACNAGLVKRIAKDNQAKGADLDDLIQDGRAGLLRSIEKFDVDRGFRFSTYASFWIKTAVIRSMSKRCAPVHVPAHIHEEHAKIFKARNEFIADHGEVPTDEQVAELAGTSIQRLQTLSRLFMPSKSLDKPIGADQTDTLKDFLEDEDAESALEVAEKTLREKHINQALETLTLREKEVIRQRFGLDDGNCKTLKEIGETYNLTRERVRQIQRKAMGKLQNAETSYILRPFVERKAAIQKQKPEKATRKKERSRKN